MTRTQLERLVADLVDATSEPTKQAIADSGVSTSDIDEIILVGGQTRMPAILQKVKDIFGKDPNQTVNPDEVVATGAAIQAGVLQGDVKDILLLDVTPLSLGIETLGGVGTVLIPRNTTIPTTKSESFTTAADNQPSVEVHVFQGERPMAKENVSIGRFMLDGILPAPRGTPQVEVAFDIDADGILKVSATDKATSKEQHITIAGRSGLSDEEIAKAVEEAESHAEEDQKQREMVEVRNAADSAIYSAEKLMTEQEDQIPDDETKTSITEAIAKVKDLLASETSETSAITDAVNDLQLQLQKVGQAAYAEQSAPTPEDEAGSEDGSDDDTPEDTVEGEFREV